MRASFFVGLPFLVSAARVKQYDVGSASASAAKEEQTIGQLFPGHGGGTNDPVLDHLIDRCIEEKAADFEAVHERLGLHAPKPIKPVIIGKETTLNYDDEMSIVQLCDEIAGLEDALEARSLGLGAMSSIFHPESRSERAGEWRKKLNENKEKLEDWGVDYDAMRKSCTQGKNSEATQCLLDKVNKAGAFEDTHDEVQEHVQRLVDLKDVVLHPEKTKDLIGLRKSLREEKEWLEAHDYRLKHNNNECKSMMGYEAKAVRGRVAKELSAGDKDENDKDICNEKADQMCPEGTFVTTARRRNMTRGGSVFVVTQIIGKIVLTPIGAAIGTSVGGPVGGTGGTLAAGAVASWIAMASGYWGSLGPKECACFPRDCGFIAEEGKCGMTTKEETPSKNEFGGHLPPSGTKCALKYKHQGSDDKDECIISPCGDDDFEPILLQDGKSRLFGTAGRNEENGTDLFNCISTTGSPGSGLTLARKLPGGKPNNVENRVELFRKILNVGGENDVA